MPEKKTELDHYVCRVVIERVDKTTEYDGSGSYAQPRATTREVNEVANFLVKSKEIEDLKGKVSNHVGLVEDWRTGS